MDSFPLAGLPVARYRRGSICDSRMSEDTEERRGDMDGVDEYFDSGWQWRSFAREATQFDCHQRHCNEGGSAESQRLVHLTEASVLRLQRTKIETIGFGKDTSTQRFKIRRTTRDANMNLEPFLKRPRQIIRRRNQSNMPIHPIAPK
jgi:hypothetical protein